MVIIISLSCLLLVVTYYILQVLEPLFLLFSSICFITILGCLLLIYQLDFFAFFLIIIYLGGVLIFLLFIILFLRQGFKPQLLPLNQAIMNYNFLILLILLILFVIYNQIFFIEPFIQIKTNLWLVCYIKITYLFTIIYSTIYDLYSSLLIVE